MSISEQITRINNEKLRIGEKLKTFGLINDPSINLETLADTVSSIPYHDCPKEITLSGEGQKFDIIAGYHKGSTVYWVQDTASEAARYLLEDRGAITPEKGRDITVTVTDPTEFYGMSQVIIKAIPHPYYDVTKGNAKPSDVLTGVKFVDSSGVTQTGNVPKNNPLNLNLTFENNSVEIPYGYYKQEALGSTGNVIGGVVRVAMEDDERTITPSASDQNVRPVSTTGYKFVKGVVVKGDTNLKSTNIAKGSTIFGVSGSYTEDASINIVTSSGSHRSPDVRDGAVVYADGKRVVGSMPIGTVDAVIGKKNADGTFSTQYVNTKQGFYSVIKVTLSSDIETELAKI